MAQHMVDRPASQGQNRQPPLVSEDGLRRWLGLLRQPDKLASESIRDLLVAHGSLPDNPSPLAVGQAGAQLILEAIERLRPPEGASREEALPHEVLNRCFIDGAKLFQAAAMLGLSERQLSRERSRAIGILKAELENLPGGSVVVPKLLPEPIPTIRGFLDRPGEIRRLKKALGDPGLVIVHGAPGIGKTTLVAEIAAEAVREVPVLWYRFRPGVNTSLSAILFELGGHLRTGGATELSDYLEQALPAVDASLATRLAIRALGDGPRLLAFDDYQLVEEDTAVRGLLGEMVERLPEIRIVAISQHRYLGMVQGTPVEIGPLARSQTAKLLSKLSVNCDDRMVRALHSWTAGNPHMIKLAASWLKAATPEEVAEGVGSLQDQAEVQDFLLGQLTNLIDPDDRRILNGASIFRSHFSDDALAYVTGRTRGAVIDSSMRLVRAYIATRNRTGDSAFFHNSVRDFIYERLDPEVRSELHSRAAEWFDQDGNDGEALHHRKRAH